MKFLINTVNLAYNVPVGTSVLCPLYTKSVLRVYRTLSVIRIYRTLSVIDINSTLSGICIPYNVRYTRKCDTVRCTTACLHHVPSWLLCIQIIHCYMYFTNKVVIDFFLLKHVKVTMPVDLDIGSVRVPSTDFQIPVSNTPYTT